jgi:hypothetical protein
LTRVNPRSHTLPAPARRVFFNTLTCSAQADRPVAPPGGLICDDMGMGKSLVVLALLLANPAPGVAYAPRPMTTMQRGARRAAEEEEEEEEEEEQYYEALKAKVS